MTLLSALNLLLVYVLLKKNKQSFENKSVSGKHEAAPVSSLPRWVLVRTIHTRVPTTAGGSVTRHLGQPHLPAN